MCEATTLLALQQALASAAGEGATPNPGQGGMWQIVFMLVPFFLIMYFFMILPNQRQQKKRAEMLANLAKGDKVVTAGGIFGIIVGLSDKSVVLRISDDPPVKIELLRTSVSRVAARDGKEIKE